MFYWVQCYLQDFNSCVAVRARFHSALDFLFNKCIANVVDNYFSSSLGLLMLLILFAGVARIEFPVVGV